MGLFSKAPKVGADGFERKTINGYVDKGPVAKHLADGWEIEHVSPVHLAGTTLKQATFVLRRRAA